VNGPIDITQQLAISHLTEAGKKTIIEEALRKAGISTNKIDKFVLFTAMIAIGSFDSCDQVGMVSITSAVSRDVIRVSQRVGINPLMITTFCKKVDHGLRSAGKSVRLFYSARSNQDKPKFRLQSEFILNANPNNAMQKQNATSASFVTYFKTAMLEMESITFASRVLKTGRVDKADSVLQFVAARISSTMVVAMDQITAAFCGNLTLSCSANQHVRGMVCADCSIGKRNEAGNLLSGDDTECDTLYCGANEYVFSHVCMSCPQGTSRPAGDPADQGNTACTTECECVGVKIDEVMLKKTNQLNSLSFGKGSKTSETSKRSDIVFSHERSAASLKPKSAAVPAKCRCSNGKKVSEETLTFEEMHVRLEKKQHSAPRIKTRNSKVPKSASRGPTSYTGERYRSVVAFIFMFSASAVLVVIFAMIPINGYLGGTTTHRFKRNHPLLDAPIETSPLLV
jgi:hypothetical protein